MHHTSSVYTHAHAHVDTFQHRITHGMTAAAAWNCSSAAYRCLFRVNNDVLQGCGMCMWYVVCGVCAVHS